MDLTKAQSHFDFLYDNIRGFELSMNARSNLDIVPKSLTYGEIDFQSFAHILEIIRPIKGEIFYDLGSGTGKPVFAATLLHPFSKAIGIELLEDLYNKSLEILKSFNAHVRNKIDSKTEIAFYNKDLITCDISHADVIYIASTCFDSKFMKELSHKMETVKKGTRIITLTKELYSDSLEQIHKNVYQMSWGDTTVYIYKKM